MASCGCIGGNTGIDECPEEEPTDDTPPGTCQLICLGDYLVLNKELCQCEKLPRPWYYDGDGDEWHDSLFGIPTQKDSPGTGWRNTTKGEDCNDSNILITNNCYKDYFIDKDNDDYDAGKISAKEQGLYKITTKGTDCDDNNTNIHKLNKCGKCEVEPVSGSCGEDCDTSAADLKLVFPKAPDAVLKTLTEILNTYAKQFGIDTKEKLQHFLTQTGHETGGFNTLSVTESLNYSATRLMEVWPSRFSQTDPAKLDPDDYASNSIKLGDYVYGGRNGNTDSGDGYLYRGRGLIQITGKKNYSEFSEFYKSNFDNKIDINANPGLVASNSTIAVISALWFFQKNVLDEITVNDITTVNQVTSGINPAENKKIKKIRNDLFRDKVKPNINCN